MPIKPSNYVISLDDLTVLNKDGNRKYPKFFEEIYMNVNWWHLEPMAASAYRIFDMYGLSLKKKKHNGAILLVFNLNEDFLAFKLKWM